MCNHEVVVQIYAREGGAKIRSAREKEKQAAIDVGGKAQPTGGVDSVTWACQTCGVQFIKRSDAARYAKQRVNVPGSTLPMADRVAMARYDPNIRAGLEREGLDWRTGKPPEPEPEVIDVTPGAFREEDLQRAYDTKLGLEVIDVRRPIYTWTCACRASSIAVTATGRAVGDASFDFRCDTCGARIISAPLRDGAQSRG